jgi:aminoglycoside phosphotransferase (APT) family kinase protein
MTRSERGAIWDELNRVIARLHCVDYRAVGLETFGKPGNYIERQVARWTKQYQASETETMEAMNNLIAWLPKNIPPETGTSVVHGDFRLDNTIFHPTEPRILAVLDWELSTLGDPLADVGQLVVYWSRPYGIGPTGADGFPDIVELTERYRERSGRDLSELGYYVAFASWRIAIILEGVYARTRAGAYGDAVDDETMPRAIEQLAERAAEAVR